MLDAVSTQDRGTTLGTSFAAARLEVAVPSETCRTMVADLAVAGLDRVPVVEEVKSGRLLGIVSRHDLLEPSASVLMEEGEREPLRRVRIPRAIRFAPTTKPALPLRRERGGGR